MKTKPIRLSEMPPETRQVWNKKYLRFKRKKLKGIETISGLGIRKILEEFCKENNLIAE